MKKLYVLVYIIVAACAIWLIYAAITNAPEMSGGNVPVAVNKAPVTRIVSLCKPVPFIVLGLDASDKRLVGVNPETQLAIRTNVLNKYFPDFRKISDKVCDNAFEPNIEELLRLKPDLIMQWKSLPEKILKMESFGFHVIGMEFDGSERTDREIVTTLAAAIDRKPKADSIMQNRETLVLKIKKVTDNIPPEQRPKVVFLYNYENFMAGGERCYENFCIELGGGRNVGKGLGIQRSVNIEQILAWNPDIILLRGWRTNVTPEDVYKNPFLKEVNAVRFRHVIKMPVWASNESVLSWKWMAKVLHPDLFGYNMREEIRSSYAWQYHINLNEADIDQVLFSKENAGSPLYAPFKQTGQP